MLSPGRALLLVLCARTHWLRALFRWLRKPLVAVPVEWRESTWPAVPDCPVDVAAAPVSPDVVCVVAPSA